MKHYFPILLSKTGELVALHHLAQEVKDDICPVIEILENTILKAVKDEDKKPTGGYEYVSTVEDTLAKHWSFPDNQIILDVSLFNDVVSNMSLVKKIFIALFKAGVNVVPAVQKNSSKGYLDFVKELIRKHDCKICIRTSNKSGEFLKYNKHVSDILTEFSRKPNDVILLLDLGQVSVDDYNREGALAGFTIQTLTTPISKWDSVVVASGSFPKDLTPIPVSDTPHKLKRFEWSIFQELKSVSALAKVKYGDYGTKYAIYEEANFAGSISVKYSTKDYFVIYRGEKTDVHADGHGQYITHAKKLVKSAHYSGADFSWGDSKVDEVSHQLMNDDKRKTGSPQTWVEYSQNHHVTLIRSIT